MKPLRPQLRGLIFKLALFYVLLSLPSLVLVESAILIYEFESFMHDVEDGSLQRASAEGARELAAVWPSATADESKGLGVWAQSWVLRLQRPRGALVGRESYILDELALEPLVVAVLAPDGHVLAQAPATPEWQPELPPPGSAALAAATVSTGAQALPGEENPYRVRRVLTPVRSADGTLEGLLFVELRLPLPWRRFLLDLSLEWPIVLGYLIVFGIASSLFLAAWVTRRLNRVAAAASAWSRGDFSDRIGDRSRDELGRLSALLDRMALELKALMQSRAQLATLSERQRLARDLHDTVKQQAFALGMQLAALRRRFADDDAAARIDQAERLCGQIQRELAQILDELRASDSALAFGERLRQRVQEWAQASGMRPRMRIEPLPELAPEIQETLLRIADEALANVLRHSAATEAAITLAREGGTALLEIADNGHGGVADTAHGMGIPNMRARALSLPDGRFAIADDAAGARVRVAFSLPA